MMKDMRPTAAEPENKNSHHERRVPVAEPGRTPARRNPRIVIGNLNYFDLLMEQEEQ